MAKASDAFLRERAPIIINIAPAAAKGPVFVNPDAATDEATEDSLDDSYLDDILKIFNKNWFYASESCCYTSNKHY